MSETGSADVKQSFLAMCKFLEMYWERGRSEEIAVLLGSLALQEDGEFADPALWEDWIRIFEEITRKSADTERDAHSADKPTSRKSLALSSTKVD